MAELMYHIFFLIGKRALNHGSKSSRNGIRAQQKLNFQGGLAFLIRAKSTIRLLNGFIKTNNSFNQSFTKLELRKMLL
jgi:hypothetical protein